MIDEKTFNMIRSFLVTEKCPNHFDLGYSGFLSSVYYNREGDIIELTPVDISEGKLPEGWGEVLADIAFVDSEGKTCGMMQMDLFNSLNLKKGETYTCKIERYTDCLARIWVPYSSITILRDPPQE